MKKLEDLTKEELIKLIKKERFFHLFILSVLLVFATISSITSSKTIELNQQILHLKK